MTNEDENTLKDLVLRWRKVNQLSQGGWGKKEHKQEASDLLEEIDKRVGFNPLGEYDE